MIYIYISHTHTHIVICINLRHGARACVKIISQSAVRTWWPKVNKRVEYKQRSVGRISSKENIFTKNIIRNEVQNPSFK